MTVELCDFSGQKIRLDPHFELDGQAAQTITISAEVREEGRRVRNFHIKSRTVHPPEARVTETSTVSFFSSRYSILPTLLRLSATHRRR